MVDIKNKELKFYLETSLKKPLKDFTEEDLSTFEVLAFDVDVRQEDRALSLEDIVHFPRVKKVVISDGMISKANIQALKDKNIPMVRFNRCAFEDDEDLALLTDLESLELIGSYNDSYDFLKKCPRLSYLAIVNPYTVEPVDVRYLEGMPQLKEVVLQGCVLEDFSSFKNCSSIEKLNILWSKVPLQVVPVLNEMPALQDLIISKQLSTEGVRPDIHVKHDLIAMMFDADEEEPAKVHEKC